VSQFGNLVAEEIPSLRRYARALTHDAGAAEDLMQSCLLRALAKHHLWQPGTSLRCWLFTMLHHLHVSQVRRSVREYRGYAAIAEFAVAHREPQLVVELLDAERAIAKLPAWQRQVLLLIGLEEMTYAQAAAALRLREGTVRSRLGRARASLRKLASGEPTNATTNVQPPSSRAIFARTKCMSRNNLLGMH
jgi:RNA polymerase sigma-70 factor, ECF subfamily